uniref:Uncharacterized protein n=1 Tax=Sphaerodactylus townsendi TaxID=933632 RepID=A0ACB8EM52_9SAUR
MRNVHCTAAPHNSADCCLPLETIQEDYIRASSPLAHFSGNVSGTLIDNEEEEGQMEEMLLPGHHTQWTTEANLCQPDHPNGSSLCIPASGPLSILPRIETSPERRAVLQRRRLRRVGSLVDVGQRLLDHGEEETQLKSQESEENREMRQALLEVMRTHNHHMSRIAEAVKEGTSAIKTLVDMLAQWMAADPPRPQLPLATNVMHASSSNAMEESTGGCRWRLKATKSCPWSPELSITTALAVEAAGVKGGLAATVLASSVDGPRRGLAVEDSLPSLDSVAAPRWPGPPVLEAPRPGTLRAVAPMPAAADLGS